MPLFNIYSNQKVPAAEAISEIIKLREQSRPRDFWVFLKELRFEWDQGAQYPSVVASVDGKHEKFALSASGVKSLNLLLDIPIALFNAASPKSMAMLYSDLVLKQTGRCMFRTVADTNGNYIRCVLIDGGKGGIVDDSKLYRWIKPIISHFCVANRWISDTNSAIRIIMRELPSVSEFFGEPVSMAMDIANSETVPRQTWVKGAMYFQNTGHTIVCPHVFSVLRAHDKDKIISAISKLVGESNADALAFAGVKKFKDEFTSVGEILQDLYKRQILTKADVLSVMKNLGKDWEPRGLKDLFVEEKGSISVTDLSKAIIKHAADMDSYPKRSSLEFVPNLWLVNTTVK